MFAPYKGRCHVCGRDETPFEIATELIGNEVRLKSLLRRAVKQLDAWEKKYGEHDPRWLPPSGEVNLLEDIEAALKSA